MLDRRLFLSQLLSSTTLALSPEELLRCGNHARDCGRDVLIPTELVLTLKPRPSVPQRRISSSGSRQNTENTNHRTLLKSYQRVCKQASPKLLQRLDGSPWQLSEEKLDVLISVIDLLANAYPMADHVSWSGGLVWRESFATSGLGGGVGIVHQFQGGERSIHQQTHHRQGDCWVFLAPQGVEYDAIDDQPVYVLFGIVLPQLETPDWRRLELDMMQRISRITKRAAERQIDWQRLAYRDSAEVSGLLNLFDRASV